MPLTGDKREWNPGARGAKDPFPGISTTVKNTFNYR